MNTIQIFEAVASGKLTPAEGADILLSKKPMLDRIFTFLDQLFCHHSWHDTYDMDPCDYCIYCCKVRMK